MGGIQTTHRVVRRRGSRIIREFLSVETAESFARKLRKRYKSNRYKVEEIPKDKSNG